MLGEREIPVANQGISVRLCLAMSTSRRHDNMFVNGLGFPAPQALESISGTRQPFLVHDELQHGFRHDAVTLGRGVVAIAA